MTCDVTIKSSSPCPNKTRIVFSNESALSATRSAYEHFYYAAVARTIARYCRPSEPGNEKKRKKSVCFIRPTGQVRARPYDSSRYHRYSFIAAIITANRNDRRGL